MESWVEIYLNHLNRIGVGEADFFRATPPDESAPISVVTYLGGEVTSLMTSFTTGLSVGFHPSWKFARPELCITVESQDPRWGWAIGDIAYKLRGKCSFCYGEIINFGTQISKESEMSAFVVFAPTFIDKEDREIQLPEWKVSFAQMYPIYEGEIGLIDRIGLEEFLQRPGTFFSNVKRKDLSH